jgi:hypothetical protein
METNQTMTEFSPAAQAIEDAYFNADGFGYRNGLAAALRALDEQLGYDVLGVRAVDSSQILLIAAELEGAN